MPVRTLAEAAAWVDRVGLALVFPKDDVVLPSLWEAAGGGDRYAERAADGTFVRWLPPMDFVWPAKSELVAEGLVCGGNHLRGRSSLIALDVLPALVAVRRVGDLPPLEQEVLDAVAEHGPLSTRELPELLAGHERKRVRAAIDRLEKALVLTNAGLEESERWPAKLVDLVDRRYADRLRDLPPPEEARATLAARLLDVVGELSAEDVRGALGWTKAESLAALEATGAPSRDDGGFRLWTRPA